MSIELMAEEAVKIAQAAADLQQLEQIRVQYLGKKGSITEQLKNLSSLSHEERREAGKVVNIAKQRLVQAINERRVTLEKASIDKQLATETIDVTLPGRRQYQGSIHPITQVRLRLESIFSKMGFNIAQGPEIETDYYNFTALNIPDHHPARAMHDTFYLEDHFLLRTHTSSVQIHSMENTKPPLRIIVPGRAYRCDSDATHTPMFHQIEGLVVDQQTSFADLRGSLESMLNAFFDRTLDFRFRPSYFPFTEPSAEVDMQCLICEGKATSCKVCKSTGWLEIIGCGMVHPNVLKNVNLDSEKYRGYAFGMGIDRLAMLLYGVDDLRLFFDNDIRFLEQF